MAWYKLDEEGNIEGLLKPLAPTYSWYNKTTGMVICSDKLIECNEELITCL